MRIILSTFFLFIVMNASAVKITGVVKTAKGDVLPFASLLIKGSTVGTTSNNLGEFELSVESGVYNLECKYVGYKTEVKEIAVTNKQVHIIFILEEQNYSLEDVIVTKGEDPAYAVIRNAIKKRPTYLREVKKFECEVYIKGNMQLRNYPKKFMGETVDFEDGDTSKRKMIFLSESVAKYYVQEPDKRKIEVLSTRVSGMSDGYGFASPRIINFYENNVALGQSINPRGLVSPIADNALNFYNYKFEGSYFENGKEINKIKVMPKRKYEPLFTGYIYIIENEWRIESASLMALKDQQMQMLDTLKIDIIYMPAGKNYVPKQQVVYPAGKIFSFDFFGSFVQVYDKYNLNPKFSKNTFNNIVALYTDSSNKRSREYWDSTRPLPLLEIEAKDYIKKDSLEQRRRDPAYLDSLDELRNKFTLKRFFISGLSFNNEKKKSYLKFSGLLSSVNYNTVEGFNTNFITTYTKRFEGRRMLTIEPILRYGFSNKHFNPSLNTSYNFGKKYFNNISISGGKKIFQFYNADPVCVRIISIRTLFSHRNYLKFYEAEFVKLGLTKAVGNGVSLHFNGEWQHRIPLENTTDYSFRNKHNRVFTPNYPPEIGYNIPEHSATIATIGMTWQPGAKYIQMPDRIFSIGSKYPTFYFGVTKAFDKLFGSDVDYSRWNIAVNDDMEMNLAGKLNYRLQAQGFFDKKKLQIPDWNHYIGRQSSIFMNPDLRTFQFLRFYEYSNTKNFSATGFVEWHLNGLLTNKIPLMKKWNWFIVTGTNALYIDKNQNYQEVFIGLENILKTIRVDFIQSFNEGKRNTAGVRVSTLLQRMFGPND